MLIFYKQYFRINFLYKKPTRKPTENPTKKEKSIKKLKCFLYSIKNKQKYLKNNLKNQT